MRKRGIKTGRYRSRFEAMLAMNAEIRGIEFEFESMKIKYQKKESTYTPDFILSNGIIVEAKGLFTPQDRTKHLLIKQQHPELDIRFVFMNSNNRLPSSKTTYASWCERHGFLYADKLIPEEWANEI